MAGTSDFELIEALKSGQTGALVNLFNRHSPALYEFIYLLIGDRDQAARLLEETFLRAYSLRERLSDSELMRGWLYGIAREASLTWLRQKNWLNALPASDEPSVAGLPGDIWRAARAMPAFHRAVLIVDDLHGLSPTEKAHALSVARTDLGRLTDEARRSFNAQFDLQARQQGRPLAALIDPERMWGMRRRGGEGSLFGYLPQTILPESLAASIRQKVITGTRTGGTQPGAPVQAAKPTAPPPIPPKAVGPSALPVDATSISYAAVPAAQPPQESSQGWNVRALAIIAVVALLIIGIAICGVFILLQDRTSPVITHVEPGDGVTLSSGLHVNISATFQDDRAVNPKSIILIVDARDVTSQALISDTSLNYMSDLDPGLHVVLLTVRDNSGNETKKPWQFNVAFAPEPTAAPLPPATSTPTATAPPVIRPSLPTSTSTRAPLPVINAFSAAQTVVTRGTSVLLTWNVTGADQVNLNQEKVDPVGFRLVTPDRTTTYQLIASSASGTVNSSVTITIEALPDLIVSDIALSPLNQITFAIRNDGTADVTRTFYVQVLANNVNIYFDRPISTLPVGQEARITVQNYFAVNTQNIVVRVNTLREVEESNYANNELARVLTGPTPTPNVTLTPSVTQTPTPTSSPTPAVTNITLSGSPTSYSGACPMNINLSATVSTSGPTTVTYQWERNGALHSGPFTTSSTGSVTLTTLYTEYITGTITAQLHITGPNNAFSNSVPFTNNCH